MVLHYKQKLNPLARTLRKNATKQENRLWYDFLKTYQYKIRRQKPIGEYIVDFYCDKAKLAIELDGSQHYEEKEISYDVKRTQTLNELGIEVIRFSNADVDMRFEGVCTKIDEAVKFRISNRNESIMEWDAD